MATESYVVTRPDPTSNVGSNLASLAGAVWLARTLERSLIVDWRGMTQLRDPSLNYFTEFFAAPSELVGVPVAYAPLRELDYDREVANAARLSPEAAAAAGAGAVRREERFLVLETYHGPDRIVAGGEGERFRALRSFYRDLVPRPEIASEAERWWAETLDGRFVVGVNVRTGNGHYFGKNGPYAGRVNIRIFENRSRFLSIVQRGVRRLVRGLPRPLREDVAIFFATDSAPMRELLGNLPNAVSRRTMFPPPGTGDTYAFSADAAYSDRDSIRDTLIDMFLLARVDGLVYNSSLFNQYARVLNGYFGGNLVHIESLYARYRLRRLRHHARAVRRRL
jgi:hypothetical protein